MRSRSRKPATHAPSGMRPVVCLSILTNTVRIVPRDDGYEAVISRSENVRDMLSAVAAIIAYCRQCNYLPVYGLTRLRSISDAATGGGASVVPGGGKYRMTVER